MMFEPLAGRRDVVVTDRRTKIDYAMCLQKLADQTYRDAETIVLVQDNLILIRVQVEINYPWPFREAF